MERLDREQLKSWMDQGENMELINVLPEENFREAHIPGSDNIPVETSDFERQVEAKAGDKDKKIVVYCASEDCPASPKAAKKLDEAGFRHVYDFEGGVKEWQDAGYALQGGG